MTKQKVEEEFMDVEKIKTKVMFEYQPVEES